MFNLGEDQVDAMRARIVFENHPGARNPYRSARILGDDGTTTWRINQGWKLNPTNRQEIVWDRAMVGFPSGILEPEEIEEMALALTVLAEVAHKWNNDYHEAIPEQMARITAEEAAHNG